VAYKRHSPDGMCSAEVLRHVLCAANVSLEGATRRSLAPAVAAVQRLSTPRHSAMQHTGCVLHRVSSKDGALIHADLLTLYGAIAERTNDTNIH
jgi:hypothetical protein